MRLVNVAHGDFILLGAILALFDQSCSHWLALYHAVILIPVMFVIGYVIQRLILNPALGDDVLRPVLVTFGLSVIVENVLLQAFQRTRRSYRVVTSKFQHGVPVGWRLAVPADHVIVCIALFEFCGL